MWAWMTIAENQHPEERYGLQLLTRGKFSIIKNTNLEDF